MTTQTDSRSSSSKILRNLTIVFFSILAIVSFVAIIKTTVYLTNNLYFFKKIEQFSGGNLFILYSLILLSSTFFALLPFSFEPLIFLTAVYYYKNFQFYQGLALTMLSTFIAINVGSIIIMLISRKVMFPYFKRNQEHWDYFNTLNDVSDSLGLLFVILARLIISPHFLYDIIFGFTNISIPQLIIGNFTFLPRYLSISVFSVVINDIDIFKDRLVNLSSDPSSAMLFTSISWISFLILVGLLHRSYLKVKGRTPLPTEENYSSLKNSTNALNFETRV
ncbi:transmembrane domain-containing protein [Cryptosporidium hominis]